MTDGVTVDGHDFRPYSRLDRLRPRQGRCSHCFFPRWAHPIPTWVEARALGDRRPAYPWNGNIVRSIRTYVPPIKTAGPTTGADDG